MSVVPIAVGVPVANRDGIGQFQKSIFFGVICVLERNEEKSLYLQDLKNIQHFTFTDAREIGILLFLYHNMLEGKDRSAEVKECMTEHEWEQFELNRDILIATFFTLLREEKEEEMSKKWWYRILQFFRIRPRTTILPESYFIR